MQTNLASWASGTDLGNEADAILRRCVHCGFCTATCPTYQVLGDELDSPRGRIYLIKQVLEGKEPTQSTQQHLDRCLTCRNCETTCPSGVEYGHLVDIGRKIVDERVERSWGDRTRRTLLRKAMLSPMFAPAMRLGQSLRGLLPQALRRKVPERRDAGPLPQVGQHARQVLMLAGCVQPAMMPTIDAATIRVLDAVGIGARIAPGAGCCGAVSFHLDAQDEAVAQMRANVDAWWPLVQDGKVEAIVMNASGCGAMVKEYAHHLRHDAAYAQKAADIVALVKDVAEIVAPHAGLLRARLPAGMRAAFHPPCTLQHWQGLRPLSEQLLADLGFELQPFADKHLCCGSAGAYSVLNPDIALELRDRKLGAIAAASPDVILSANIGCIGHLQSGTDTPVRHWVEVVDEQLRRAAQG
ncbi:glycolate oxidase subunit GlcF [Achromobacter mucicolens]|jgi:glycolate oxidase iron-sulfur subunit|uniref:Glycolate oxidase iron-sulfur subunit n=3 Tax=Achromobacter mucicolens TaxID=1389922 RepID=A0ABD4YU77_9BURK|nr:MULTISPECIES: glycolate oxidase subunit GlcF [Achromobacter]MCU6615398.1 glycolate oxidase subunit GlcF [Achromobacter mucicolens]MDF2860250.1 glycolate oxidase iron-sulfur subunit [Achromobacter mucicolens]MDH1178731.1 glycolate oxidase subunit GlcF [Achromobacter mucicolens]TQJ93863.1 glycolate oxidase iron-sulfur subunit [Achromobacter sp. SLBN-14]UDG77238.1 glycolate oxidase subunit GlcF [Achromobacter sp. 77]